MYDKPYSIRAYEVPIDSRSEHEEEIGEADSITEALRMADKWANNFVNPTTGEKRFLGWQYLVYISEWDMKEEELITSKAAEEWIDDLKKQGIE